MSGRPAQREVRPAGVQPANSSPVLHPGPSRETWCLSCRAWTGIAADLLLLSAEGVWSAGTLTWCEVCEDPRNPMPVRRIDRD